MGKTSKIKRAHHKKICEILDFLNAIGELSDCNGQFDSHSLHGVRKDEYAMSVSGNYRVCFKWDGEDVYHLTYEDYH
ncbi:type II toxin-antitoxin system RelE/ParE family toxin [Candidatus Acetothermia bacterium]|nr:type II toxin-antitoxin system RelE/ParE family toxin [Candidatus Acetothermia bacterium]MBI3642703.1 type II toxin-antitoxin system RelE/ParE family toxin [Candidatus Acetothermia bacterium]